MWRWTILLILCASACTETGSRCAGVECGDNGVCEETVGSAQCVCDVGYSGETCAIPEARVLDEFRDRTDPDAWATDSTTGKRYRRATSDEIDVNGLLPGTFLVEAGTESVDLARGAATVRLLLPTSDEEARASDLMLFNTESDHLQIELALSGEDIVVNTAPKDFHSYRAGTTADPASGGTTLGSELYSLVSTSTGAFVGHGYGWLEPDAGFASLEILGPERGRVVRPIEGGEGLGGGDVYVVTWSRATDSIEARWPTTPVGDFDPLKDWLCPLQPPCDPMIDSCPPCSHGKPPNIPPGSSAHQCNDDDDDDGDGIQDPADPDCAHTAACDHESFPNAGYPSHTHKYESGKYFGVFGDIVFCTRYSDNWQALLYSRANVVRAGFDSSATANLDYNDYVFPFAVQPMRLVATKCWKMQGDDPEAALQAAKDCRNEGDCGPYNSGVHTYPYRGLGDAKAEAPDYFEKIPDDLKHAVQLEQPYNAIEFPMDALQLVVYENGHGQWGGTADDGVFGSLVNEAQSVLVQAQRHTSSTHEFGHTFGCTHAIADKYDDTWSVMASNELQGSEANSRVNKFSAGCAELVLEDLLEREKPAGGSRFGL